MKEISELNFPDDLKYAENHEWSKLDNDEVTIGICDYAQDQLDLLRAENPIAGPILRRAKRLELSLPVPEDVCLQTGQIANLTDHQAIAGEHHLRWNGSNNNGIQMNSGIYFFNIQGAGISQAIKIVKLD